jgi:predicted metalloprotease with PDZ domain
MSRAHAIRPPGLRRLAAPTTPTTATTPTTPTPVAGAMIVAVALAHSLVAQGAPQTRSAASLRSAPISDVTYEVTLDSLTAHARMLAVAMHFKVDGPGPVILALPAWSPGHYELLWFARRVSSFSPMVGGTPLAWRQLDFQTWQLDGTKPGSHVTVAFDYLADTIDRAVAWTRPNFGFFNGTNVFMYPVGRGFSWPAEVIIHTEPSWRIATGMTELPRRRIGGMHHDYDYEYPFSARNYHDLVDMPFFVGQFDLDSVAVPGLEGDRTDHWVRAATYPAGAVAGTRMTRMLGWLAKLAPVHAAVFRDLPWKTYTVLQVSDTVVNGGGLEHQNSQLDEITLTQLDAPYLPWLYAHEMFHAWNVKRLRPADLVPYRYDDAQPTGWLWVSEGVTDYYAHLGVARAGISDSATLFAQLGATISQVADVLPTALPDASLRPWIKPTDGSGGLYYPKGALAGFLLDVLIRDASDNRRSLDDVMRGLYRSTYQQGRGFTPAEWWAAVARAGGPHAPRIAWADVRRRYIEGREAFPWDTVLPLAGLRLVSDTTQVVRFGILAATDSSGVRITFVRPGGAAASVGIKVDDVIDRVCDIDVRSDSSFDAIRSKYAGATGTIPVVLRRDGQSMTVQLPIRTAPDIKTRLVPIADASPRAVRIRHGLVAGTTD